MGANRIVDGVREFAEKHGMTPPPTVPDRVEVHLGADLSEVAKKFGGILAGAPLFRRDGRVVVVDEEARALRVLHPADFCTRVQKWCLTYRQKKKKEKDGEALAHEVTMKAEEGKFIMANADFLASLRPVARVNAVRMPTVRADGSLVLLPEGYDTETATWTMRGGVKVREDSEVEWATQYLRELLQEFPWSDEHGRSLSCQVAAMLTPFVINMMGEEANRPCFVYTANAPGSGKSLLAKMAITATVGTSAGKPLPRTDDAMDQFLSSAALSASGYLFFDNCERRVNPPLLAAWITQPDWPVRLMHTQQAVETRNVSTVYLTGNDFVVGDDIERRAFFIDMFVEEVEPTDRVIHNPIDGKWLKMARNRGDMLSALWAMIRRWNEMGRPADCKRRNSFEEWSELVGGVMVANGFTDPHERPEMLNSGNREKDDVMTLVADCMPAKLGEEEDFDFIELITLCRRLGLFNTLPGRADGLPPIEEQSDMASPGSDSEEEDHREINKDISQSTRTALGIIFRKWCQGGRVYRTENGTCRFGVKGKKRHSRYVFARLED